ATSSELGILFNSRRLCHSPPLLPVQPVQPITMPRLPMVMSVHAEARRTLRFQPSTLVALLVAGAFFMENLDGTVIATALPQMALSFRASPVDLNMGMTAYMLALAVFIPVSGWVADRLGARRVFASAIGLFTFASILCGMSN